MFLQNKSMAESYLWDLKVNSIACLICKKTSAQIKMTKIDMVLLQVTGSAAVKKWKRCVCADALRNSFARLLWVVPREKEAVWAYTNKQATHCTHRPPLLSWKQNAGSVSRNL